MRCVTDTNVWIDLHVGGLLGSVFELNISWIIPDLIFDELQEPSGAMLLEWGLERRSLSGDEVEAVVALASQHSRPSRADLTALVLAEVADAILVTGDGALREAAEAEGVEVHGTLWITDMLVESEIVAPEEAARSLQLMVAADRHLPKREVQRRIKRWQ